MVLQHHLSSCHPQTRADRNHYGNLLLQPPNSRRSGYANEIFLLTYYSAHPHPPEEGYLFYVKNTKIIVKFKNYIQMNNRNETEVAQVLRAATADVFKSGKTPVMPEFDHIWRAGQVDLEVSPQKGKLEQKQALTWTWWHAAITAFREFTKEYPGLCFQYELFVNDKDDRGKEDEFWLGEGLLGFW